jgi:YidC/Oxa1 family membrane protein insertase
MDRNTIIGLVLIFLILMGYSIWTAPSKEEKARATELRDSIALIKRAEDSLRALELKTQAAALPAVAASDSLAVNAGVVADSVPQTALTDKFGPFAASATGEENHFFVENDLFRIKFSSKGGNISNLALKKFVTWDSLPLYLIDEQNTRFAFSFFASNRSISSSDLYFVPVGPAPDSGLKVSGDDSLRLTFRAYASAPEVAPADGDSALMAAQSAKYLEFVYTIHGSQYMIDFDIRFVGLKQDMTGNVDILLDWSSDKRQLEKSHQNEKILTTIYFQDNLGDVDFLSERKNDEENLSAGAHWVGLKQQFFTTTIISENLFSAAKLKVEEKTETASKDGQYLRTLSAELSIPYDNSDDYRHGIQFFFGPTKYKDLRAYKMKLERQIPLGWSFAPLAWINRFAVIPVFNFLESFNLNYGIIILILTILLKILLFPIAYKTYVSGAKMRVLRPEVEEINKKFPKQDEALKRQQATMELYKRAGASPMAGCVPMLLQFPILIAMFRFFPASIELRQESFLWATDLSSYDSIIDLGFKIPFYGDHVSLFTLLMTISTIIYTWMNNQMMGSTQQIPGMKTMMYLMPIMFLGFFNSYASGLSYYYLLANLITFGQMWIFRRTIDEDALHKRIQENKKKPVKKSRFQQRLEEAAKSRGYNPSRK